jgi:hypothetical protein
MSKSPASGWLVLLCCAVCLPAARAADFYVDPQAGSPDGDGSAADPWRSLQAVVDAGLIESRQWESLPYEQGAALVARNPGAPVGAGDTIYLRSGFHGALSISGYYNSDFITIAAAPGHQPRLSRILLRACGHWVLRGLAVSPEYAPDYEPATLIDLDSHGWQGPVRDVVVENCRLQSVADSSGWSAADWNALACNGIGVDGTRMTVRGNTLRNVDFGISVGASHALVEHNLVENFSGDGLRGLGDYSVFQYNTVRNCYDVNQNHDDGFQSWSNGPDGVGSGEVVGIELRGNRIVNYVDPDQPHRGTLQGIGCFDGTFVDWVVENNVIVTDHWHGITLLGARGCRVVNNTVLDTNDERPGPPWVSIGAHKDGTEPTDCIVRNNLTTSVNVDGQHDVAVDHNLIIEDAAALFVEPAARDLHLLADAAAVDSGSAAAAPAIDIEGVARPQGAGIDIGAYEYSTGVEPDGGVDADSDAGVDAGPDAGVDAGTDAGMDAGLDAGADAGTDGGGDAAGADPGSDAGFAVDAGAAGQKIVGSGCRCAAAGPGWPALLPGLCLGLLLLRRRSACRRR